MGDVWLLDQKQKTSETTRSRQVSMEHTTAGTGTVCSSDARRIAQNMSLMRKYFSVQQEVYRHKGHRHKRKQQQPPKQGLVKQPLDERAEDTDRHRCH